MGANTARWLLLVVVGQPACAGPARASAAARTAAVVAPAGTVVRRGEGLIAVARRLHATPQAVARANGLARGRPLRPGMRLVAPPAARRGDSAGRGGRGAVAGRRKEARSRGRGDAERPRRLASAPALAWPARGPVTSAFGVRGVAAHDGIDIGAAAGSPVRAAAAGEVVYAAHHGTYGRLVILEHGRGLMTVYAHHSANLVQVGQRVRRGEAIARVGASGRARGAHLHFEVRQQSRPTDPLRLLPRP